MAVRIQTYYRLTVWFPIILPAILAGTVHGLGLTTTVEPVDRIVFILLASLLYGGVPYGLLGIWATWRIDRRPESEIKRLMLQAPLLMIAMFVPIAALVGLVVVGRPQAATRGDKTTRTRIPSRANMSMSASVLNRSMRPRRRSLTRGCVTPRILAASACFNARRATAFCTAIIKSERIKRCSASSRENPRSRNTLPLEGVIFNRVLRAMAASSLGQQGLKPATGDADVRNGFQSFGSNPS